MKNVTLILFYVLTSLTICAQNTTDYEQQNKTTSEKIQRKKLRKVSNENAVNAIKEHKFVMEVNTIYNQRAHSAFRNEERKFRVQGDLNFISVKGNKVIIQLLWSEDQEDNGIGGITYKGNISDFIHKGEEGKNQEVSFNVIGAKLNAVVKIRLDKSNNRAEAYIESQTNKSKVRVVGNILPTLLSNTYTSGMGI